MSYLSGYRRVLFMIALIFAGEAVYALPFHLARYFRPTVLEVFNLSATELGAAQGIYGVVAMLAYFPGGPLADRFPARKLLAFSLWTTALGGLYLSTFPGYTGAVFVWAFFGITTILFFWAALIRATRDWGGEDSQGRAYGLLDSGRGLLAAAMASLGVLLFSLTFPDGYATASMADKEWALRMVIYGYTGVTALTGVFVWFAIPHVHPAQLAGEDHTLGREPLLDHILHVLSYRAVWLQAIVILCAYVAYKGFDMYSLFAVQAWGMDEVEAAAIVTIGSWVRPVAALGAGLLGDRFTVSRMLLLCFLLLLGSDLFFAFVEPVPGAAWIRLGNTLIACTAIFGLRGLYFALYGETRLPAAMTGTAVGLVSVIGYTPDIFVTLVAGILIDNNPGVTGHQYFFMFLSAFAAVGVLASLMLMKTINRPQA